MPGKDIVTASTTRGGSGSIGGKIAGGDLLFATTGIVTYLQGGVNPDVEKNIQNADDDIERQASGSASLIDTKELERFVSESLFPETLEERKALRVKEQGWGDWLYENTVTKVVSLVGGDLPSKRQSEDRDDEYATRTEQEQKEKLTETYSQTPEAKIVQAERAERRTESEERAEDAVKDVAGLFKAEDKAFKSQLHLKQFPPSINVCNLNGINGFAMKGVLSGDGNGQSVSSAGDVNADGIADFMVSSPYASPNGKNSGEVYVLFGHPDIGQGGFIDLSSLDGRNGFVLSGNKGAYHEVGLSISAVGDINADGINDMLISSGGSKEAYVVFGHSRIGQGGFFDLSNLNGTNGFVLETTKSFGSPFPSVSAAGDVNADGIADFLIGDSWGNPDRRDMAGITSVVFGHSYIGQGGFFDLSYLNGTNGFRINGIAEGDNSGSPVCSVGDVNADGIADLLIAAPQSNRDSTPGAQGDSYIVFGHSAIGSEGSIELSELNGTNGFVLKGKGIPVEGKGYDLSVSAAGDVNADGIADFMIGSPDTSPGNPFSGTTYIIFGHPNIGDEGFIDLRNLNGQNGFMIDVHNYKSSTIGLAVSAAGDVNADGIADFLIGGNLNDSSGDAFVVFGHSNIGRGGLLGIKNLNGTKGFKLAGCDYNQWLGNSVSEIGDVNDDGIMDILIGDPLAFQGGRQKAGASYVIFGQKNVSTFFKSVSKKMKGRISVADDEATSALNAKTPRLKL